MATAAEMVTAIDEAVAALVADPVAEVQINGRRWRYHDLAQLAQLRRYYSDVAARASGSTFARAQL